MAGQDIPTDPAKALEYKEKGNKCFQAGDYAGAEELYSQAISYDPKNSLLYTNRSLALLKLHRFALAITLSQQCISLSPPPSISLKAHFQLAQAQIALHHPSEALESAKIAHALCVEEVIVGGKGANNIGPITELVLRCKKELWEVREEERLRGRGGLLSELIAGLERDREAYVYVLRGEGKENEVEKVEERYRGKIEELRRTFELAGYNAQEAKKRKVPDWCLDDITFSVMLDPVVTKTGQSYDRSSIMEHLKRSPTDPLTREPLRVEDLRPNLALKAACEEFLEENGWAVDW
ncbi:U-box-domain-containing protein [Hyaloscypha variabilis F]|uniref:U-box-domain-containing protein n=1 Tax=Hyaloscypha variabilis (strain UAMH 11265 / GT02V1 / F) TaxID=1149755 RepID=A0A2J6S8R5_HYAVF|nr:U-box-domain-containing protein [Hyaloscypha variabilis F]